MSLRPLLVILGVTLGDYLLWKWSLSGHHDTISEVAGLTLPVLGAACAWLVVVNGMRLLTDRTSAPARRTRRRPGTPSGQADAGSRNGSGAAAARKGRAGSSRDKLAA